jgi:glycosyltransferase involved in cell wall biosynthesis
VNKRILINCSNLHVGGGVAVASSVIDCISKMDSSTFDDLKIHLLVSTKVDGNLKSLGMHTSRFAKYEVADFYGVSAIWKGLGSKLGGYHAVFTVFGPAYTFRKIENHFVGFAQPNIIYPENPVFKDLSLINKVKTRLKYFFQKLFFSLASSMVVELPHVKNGLLQSIFFRNKKIYVVESAVHSVFSNKEEWEPLSGHKMESENVKLGLVSRNYPHKNLKVLPEVKRLLKDEFNMPVSLYVTFTDDEWHACDKNFQQSVVNVGPLKLSQCPSFYANLDGVIFPTVLECFSAVPIETFMLKKPLFVSDRSFIRDICGVHANYFDPLSPYSIAISIHKFFSLPAGVRSESTKRAHDFVQELPGPDVRALRYLDMIRSELNDY